MDDLLWFVLALELSTLAATQYRERCSALGGACSGLTHIALLRNIVLAVAGALCMTGSIFATVLVRVLVVIVVCGRIWTIVRSIIMALIRTLLAMVDSGALSRILCDGCIRVGSWPGKKDGAIFLLWSL